MADNVVEFSIVSYKAGKSNLLSNVSFSVAKNTIHAILGPNGAGKSTIMKLATGLLKPTSGTIKICSRDIINRENLRHVGSLIEAVSLYNHLTVIDNLLVIALQHGVKKSNVFEMLDVVGLLDQHNKKAKDLSMGMKQRLGIAMALIHRPKLLLLDEPTNGLDPEGAIAIRQLLVYLNRSCNVAILFTSHVLTEVDKIANDLTLIRNGNIVFTGSAKEFKSSNKIEEEYLNRVN